MTSQRWFGGNFGDSEDNFEVKRGRATAGDLAVEVAAHLTESQDA
jgi:hypothetical protein